MLKVIMRNSQSLGVIAMNAQTQQNLDTIGDNLIMLAALRISLQYTFVICSNMGYGVPVGWGHRKGN